MNIYVDESGNLGTKDRYFVIAMCRCDNPKRLKNFVKRFCGRRGLLEIKSAFLSDDDRKLLISLLKMNDNLKTPHTDHEISYIVLDKDQIRNQRLFEDKNVLYNYLFSFLIKRTLMSTQEDVHILFDNHTTKVKSINSLSDYIKIKAWTEWGVTKNIQIDYIDSKNSKCVQIADLIANTVFRRYNRGEIGHYDSLRITESVKFPRLTFGV